MDAPEPRITLPLGATEYVVELNWPDSNVPCASSSLVIEMFPEPSNVTAPALRVARETPYGGGIGARANAVSPKEPVKFSDEFVNGPPDCASKVPVVTPLSAPTAKAWFAEIR